MSTSMPSSPLLATTAANASHPQPPIATHALRGVAGDTP